MGGLPLHLRFLQGLLMVLLLCVIAEPAAHALKRGWAHWQSESIWAAWKSQGARSHSSGDPVGWLRLPSVNVSELIVSDATKENLRKHPCLHVSSFVKGHPRVVMAHRDTHFRKLKDLQPGHDVRWEWRDGSVEHLTIASAEVVHPDEVPQILANKEASELVLMTCWPFDYIGPAPKRVLFHAVPSGR